MNEVRTSRARTFRARTLHDALNVVRRELGADAVIVQTRRAPANRLWPWARREVEVTAQVLFQSDLGIGTPAVVNRIWPDSDHVPAAIHHMDEMSAESFQPTTDANQRVSSLQQFVEQLTQQLEPAGQELTIELQSLLQDLIRAGERAKEVCGSHRQQLPLHG